MNYWITCLGAAVIAAAAASRNARASDLPTPASIVRIELPPEDAERQPFALPTEPENTLEIDFPWPVEDWAGRGFTPDPEKFAGDFVVQAIRGKARLFVTPVTAQAHRVLLVVLAEPGGRSRGLPLELVPAPAGLAWRKVVFAAAQIPKQPRITVTLTAHPTQSRLREPSPESVIGLIRTMRLILNASAEGAAGIAAANPSLQLCAFDAQPTGFGAFSITNRFALRDASTDTLGLCVSVANKDNRRLFFEPTGWVIRAGDRAYPVKNVDFPGELEPGATQAAFLVLGRGPNAEPTLLLPDNTFEVSAVLTGSVNPRPVTHDALEGFEIK